jgi:hypothetical protein
MALIARPLRSLDQIAAAVPSLIDAVTAASDAELGMRPLVRERNGGSGGQSDPTASIALDPRLSRARNAHREALRAIEAAALELERAQVMLGRAFRYADAPEPAPTYAHLPPARRAELSELAEINARASSVVLERGPQ